jgi:hypothetical protein
MHVDLANMSVWIFLNLYIPPRLTDAKPNTVQSDSP